MDTKFLDHSKTTLFQCMVDEFMEDTIMNHSTRRLSIIVVVISQTQLLG